jgi:two-component system chemotaxis response regulator CheB
VAIKVFVVDDSAVVRQTMQHLLQGDPDIELIGSAPNPLIAAPIIRKTGPTCCCWTSRCPAWTA